MHKLALALAASLTLAACGSQSAPPAPTTAAPPKPAAAPDQPTAPTPPKSVEQLFADRLDGVLAGPWRSDANKARDQYRHPKETLSFFHLKPGQTVIEITPGAGWYTEVLAPLYKGQGKLVAALADPASADKEGTQKYLKRGNDDYRAKLAGDAEHYGEVEVREFSIKQPSLGADNSADVVVTFRNVHNFLMWNADQALFDELLVLRPPKRVVGGVTLHF